MGLTQLIPTTRLCYRLGTRAEDSVICLLVSFRITSNMFADCQRCLDRRAIILFQFRFANFEKMRFHDVTRRPFVKSVGFSLQLSLHAKSVVIGEDGKTSC